MMGGDMSTTYKAILRGDRVEWLGEAPDTNGGVAVQITVIQQETPAERAARGQAVLEALNALAASGAAEAFGDPLEWQREIRKDRPLPGRDE
jgi:hypothetical protein